MKKSKIVVAAVFVVAALSLLCGCASVSHKEAAAQATSEAFSFVVIGDRYGWATIHEDPFTQPAPFRRAIEEINLLDPDLVMFTGDLISGYTDRLSDLEKMWDGYDAAVARFTMPYYQVLGNHDVSFSHIQERIYLERYGSRFPRYYSFDHKGCHFIVLDSEIIGEEEEIVGDQLAWLKRDLEGHRNAREIFVFLHRPLWEYPTSNWMEEVHPLLANYKVDTVFCGHLHRYSKTATLDGVRYVITGGAGGDIKDSEVAGDFYHYCVVTVRDGKATIAVVKIGHIENEEVVNEAVLAKIDRLVPELRPIGLRLERGATKLPESLDIAVANEFDQDLTGTLSWELPEGSPWKLPAMQMPIDVKPGKVQKIKISVPPGGSGSDVKPLEPFPIGIWNLFVGGKTLLVNAKAEVILDRWPYTSTLQRLKKIFGMDDVKAVLTGSKVESVLVIRRKNPTEWPIDETISWWLPKECHWKISPSKAEIHLAPHESEDVKFDVSFAAAPGEVFPVPRVDSVVKLDDEEILKSSTRLPIRLSRETEGAILSQPRVARCIRAETGPTLDGALDDAVWKKCPKVSGFLLLGPADDADYQTEACFAYDEENLYAGFRSYEPKLSGLSVKFKNHDESLWLDDSIEVFLDTKLDRDNYYHYVFNADAVTFDEDGTNPKWEGPCTAKTGREANAWTLEVAIPWKSIGMRAPKSGDKMGLEVVRTRVQEPYELSQWSPTFAGNHVPSRFGILTLE